MKRGVFEDCEAFVMSSADESKDIIRDVKNFFGVSPTTKDGRPKTDAEVKEEYNQKRSLYKEQLRDLVKKERILLNDHPNHRCSSRTLDVFYGFKQSPRNVGSPFKTLMRCLWSKPGYVLQLFMLT